TFDIVTAAPDDAENAVRFRRGWFLGDGTGAGKGRQVAGVLLDSGPVARAGLSRQAENRWTKIATCKAHGNGEMIAPPNPFDPPSAPRPQGTSSES
ncbi:MAG: strawberry notch family protein, partial [Methylocystis sp.]